MVTHYQDPSHHAQLDNDYGADTVYRAQHPEYFLFIDD